MRLYAAVLLLTILTCCSCAKTYYITRYNGEKVAFDCFALGDHEFYYFVKLYGDGQLEEERYGFKRKISPVLEQAASMAESALAGAKNAL